MKTKLTRLVEITAFIAVLALTVFALASIANAADAVAPAAPVVTALPTVTADAAAGTVTVALPPAWEAIWLRVLSIAGTIVLVARVIVKLTPSPADDTFLDKVITFLKHLGLSTPPDKP
jgi:hypothetical protein